MKKEKAEVALFDENGEVTYKDYKRQPITIHHYKDGTMKIREKVNFPENHSPETFFVSRVAICTSEGVIWEGALYPPIKVESSISPQFNTSELVIEEKE